MEHSNNNNDNNVAHIEPTSVANEAPSNNKEDGNGNNLEDQAQDLRCPICLDFYIEPERTDCRHIFCKFCINHWFHNRGRSMCPQCRHTVRRTTPAMDMSQKVEEYVANHLTQELKDERKKMRQSRQTASASSGTASGRRRRNRARNVTSLDQESFSEFPEQAAQAEDEERIYSYPDLFPPSTTTRRPPPQSSGHGQQDEEDNHILDVTLNEFEFRLERAQRAYGLVVGAQRELNHQLSHLGSLALRLETYDELLSQSRRHGHTTVSPPSNTFASASAAAYYEDMSNYEQYQQQQQHTHFMNHANSYHNYMDPTSNNNIMAGWHQLYHHWPSPHFIGGQYHHHHQHQQQRSMTLANDNNDNGHSSGCHLFNNNNIIEEERNEHYGCSRSHHPANNNNSNSGGGNYSAIVHDHHNVISQCSSSQPDPPSDTSVNVNVNLINNHISSASSLSGSSRRRAARAQAAAALARRRREQRHVHDQNGGGSASLYCDHYGRSNIHNNCISTIWGQLEREDDDDDEDDEEYFERITSHLAENELAEAIERSLLLDMLDLSPPAQQMSVRSSRMSIAGTTSTNSITRPGSGPSRRRCRQHQRDPHRATDFVVVSGSESPSDGLSPSFDHLELLHRRHENGNGSRVSDPRRRPQDYPCMARRGRHANL